MMKSEFEAMAGVRVSADEYREIEKEYMNSAEIDKRKWIINWMQEEEGLTKLMNKRLSYIIGLESELTDMTAKYENANEKARRAEAELTATRKVMNDTLKKYRNAYWNK